MSQVLASHCYTKVVTISLLAAMCRQGSRFDVTCVVLSSMVVDNDYQRNCDDFKTTRDGLARHGNVKGMRVAVSNEIWTESQRIVLPSPKFQHVENLPTNGRIISVVCGGYRIRQRQLMATHDDWRQIQNCNSQLNVACCYPLFVIEWTRLNERLFCQTEVQSAEYHYLFYLNISQCLCVFDFKFVI